jgi:hypothetical protein
MSGVSEGPKTRRLQFNVRGLLLFTAAVACMMGFLSHRYRDRPLVVVVGIADFMLVMMIMVIVCMLPERFGRWLRPLAAIAFGILSMFFGIWAKNHF